MNQSTIYRIRCVNSIGSHIKVYALKKNADYNDIYYITVLRYIANTIISVCLQGYGDL